MNKILISLVAIVIVFWVVFGISKYFPGGNEVPNNQIDDMTKDWKTFRSENYGIEFKYPKEYNDLSNEPQYKIAGVIGYFGENQTLADPEILPDTSFSAHSVTIKPGETFQEAMIRDTYYDPSGLQPQSFSEFRSRTVGEHNFYYVVTSRFEGLVSVNYYLPREKDVIVFTSVTHGVDWMNPELDIDAVRGHKTLRDILATLKLFTPSSPVSQTKLYFVNENLPEFATSCAATSEVIRTIPKTLQVADASLRELFKGPNERERSQGMINNFLPAKGAPTGTKTIGEYYKGVKIENGTAIVDFQSGALYYLNSAACMQESVKAPIEKTLKQFPTIKKVEYSIEGKVFTEWDA